MGNSILRGIRTALMVTIITLVAGMFWTSMGFGGLTMSTLVDIGLIASCVAAGFRAGRESGQWILGGFASLGYVALCIVLLALFLKVSGWGAIQVLAEGGLIGMLAGTVGAGIGTGKKRATGTWQSFGRPSYSSWGSRSTMDEWDSHLNDWDAREALDEFQSSSYREDNLDQKADEWPNKGENRDWKADEWVGSEETKNRKADEWESWVREEKKKQTITRNAWWEEDVL